MRVAREADVIPYMHIARHVLPDLCGVRVQFRTSKLVLRAAASQAEMSRAATDPVVAFAHGRAPRCIRVRPPRRLLVGEPARGRSTTMANVREMKHQLGEAGEDVAEAAGESIEAMRGELRRLREKLRANGAHLEEELREAGERFAEGAKTFGSAAAEQVKAHPMAAFGIAFAAGFILSRALRRR
ncbi:hypothetical protein [Dokdonella sp.]|uniref:hypothetical protein n=1 Tax=Dokdonella sp. TaxID=2291710 RepID=UPI002F400EBD